MPRRPRTPARSTVTPVRSATPLKTWISSYSLSTACLAHLILHDRVHLYNVVDPPMRVASLALASLFLAPTVVAAAPASPWDNVADPVFLRIDQKALPHPAVYAVTQDAAGFLWVGTPGGLARYDGYQFKTFRDVGVQALLADPRGKLWIGTPSSGLASFDLVSEHFQMFHPRSATVIALARAAD